RHDRLGPSLAELDGELMVSRSDRSRKDRRNDVAPVGGRRRRAEDSRLAVRRRRNAFGRTRAATFARHREMTTEGNLDASADDGDVTAQVSAICGKWRRWVGLCPYFSRETARARDQ